jgi:hypothetical protein
VKQIPTDITTVISDLWHDAYKIFNHRPVW